MRIIDPQTATLTNIEVLAFFTANPPRRPPNPPPNARNWVPSPDLRDHNTVVKEIHNYIHRVSPHLLNYPRYVHEETLQQLQQQQEQGIQVPAPPPPAEPTPLDTALRELVRRLQPYGLTKGEVLTIVNLGVGLDRAGLVPTNSDSHGQDVVMENGEGEGVGGGGITETVEEAEEGIAQNEEEAEGQEAVGEDDYGARALLDSVVEEREERLSDDDVTAILTIIRETLGKRNG